MGDKIKVALLERNGTEILENEEVDLVAEVVEVRDPAAIGYNPANDDVR